MTQNHGWVQACELLLLRRPELRDALAAFERAKQFLPVCCPAEGLSDTLSAEELGLGPDL